MKEEKKNKYLPHKPTIEELDKARDEMREALRQARLEKESEFPIVPQDLSRIEVMAYNVWASKMAVKKRDVLKITEGERADYFDELEKISNPDSIIL